MATGWAGDGAVQQQIDDSIKDAIERARARLCIACQAEADREVQAATGYNRRGSKDRQLR